MWGTLSAAVSFNIIQFSEMKCNIMCKCTAATQRVTSAGRKTTCGNYHPIKKHCSVVLLLLSACYSEETNTTITRHLSFTIGCHLYISSALFSLFVLGMSSQMRTLLHEVTLRPTLSFCPILIQLYERRP